MIVFILNIVIILNMFDKTQFLKDISLAYLIKFERMFSSRYRFIGDVNFTTRSQLLFFKTIFREGKAAVILDSTKQMAAVFRYYPMPGKNKPAIGINGKVEYAALHPAWLNWQGYGSFSNDVEALHNNQILKDDKFKKVIFRGAGSPGVIFYQDFVGDEYKDMLGMKTILQSQLEELARRHLKASLYNIITGDKIVSQSDRNTKNIIEQKLYEVGSVINLEEDYDEIEKDSSDIGFKASSKISKLDLGSFDPNIFLDSLIKYEQVLYRLFGFRTSQLFKKERMISGELNHYNFEFKAHEIIIQESLHTFIEDYKIATGKQLKLVDNIFTKDEVNEEKNENIENYKLEDDIEKDENLKKDKV